MPTNPGRAGSHIDADNRLSWFLGRLEGAYGDCAIYVHLRRNERDTAPSFVRRYDTGIILAYRTGILYRSPSDLDPLKVALDYCHTVNRNIEAFLKSKTRTLRFLLERAQEDFRRFWAFIGAEGDLTAALQDWEVRYNAPVER